MQYVKSQPPSQTITRCNNCGGSHAAKREKCPAFGQQCHSCQKFNHFKSCCKSKPCSQNRQHPRQKTGRQTVNEIEIEEQTREDETFYVDGVEVDSHVDCVILKAIEKDEGFVTMHINGKPTEIKVDTGAKCNVMSLDTFRGLNSGQLLVKQKNAASLVAYGDMQID